VVEAAVLPTVGYVAGPAETAYLGEVGPLFESHGITQPMVFPRFSVQLVERKVAKVLEKLSLEPTDARPSAARGRRRTSCAARHPKPSGRR
jgi:uncharacterized protein YllA (UPF0747 family)